MTTTEANPTPLHTADIFTDLIIAFLTPMFLAATGGDPHYARMAAIETVNAHAARNPADLLPIAQIIACGLAVLDFLSRSMAENLSIPLILRLRGNAASLNRAAATCRRSLQDPPYADPYRPDPEAERQHEQHIIADLARLEQRLAPSKTNRPTEPPAAPTPRPTKPAPAPTVATPRPTPKPERADHEALAHAAAQQSIADLDIARPVTGGRAAQQVAPGPTPLHRPPTTQDEDRRNLWAAAMTAVAHEYTAELATLQPSRRRAATIRAAALSSVAQHLLAAEPTPPRWSAPPEPPHPSHA